MTAKKRTLLDFSAVAPAPLMVRSRIQPHPDAPEDYDLDIREEPAILPPKDAMPEAAPEPQSTSLSGAADPDPADLIAPGPPGRRAPAVSRQPDPPAPMSLTPLAVSRIKDPAGWPYYLVGFAIAAVWALAPIAYAVGYRGQVAPLQSDPLAMIVFALLAIGPALFVILAAFLLHQGQKLAAEARRGKAMAETMLLPAALAAAEAGSAVEAVRGQIAEAAAEASRARESMLAMREVMAHETGRLAEAAAVSTRTANALAETLGRQHSEMTALASTLDAQSAGVGEAITRQGRMVTEAADLAVAQIQEAEAALAARAADLAAAAGEASDTARVASEDLARQVGRLETAGLGVGDQMRQVEEGLTEQRAALVTVAHAMRADQEDFAAQIETRQAQLTEYITHARLSSAELGEKAGEGAEALRNLIAEAAGQIGALVQAAQDEREALDEQSGRLIGATAEAAARERTALAEELQASMRDLAAAADEAKVAAEGHADAAQGRIDHLNEAAFAAAQKADAIFESRLNDARNLIAQSAQMVDEAGTQTLAKLAAGVTDAREALGEMQSLLTVLDERTARLPGEARDRAEEVRVAVEQNMEDLLETARRAAEQTQAIDAAFQERVRRNYEMLTEAARLMGSVAGAAGNVGATNAAFGMPLRAPREHRAPEARAAVTRPAGRPLPQPVDAEAPVADAPVAEQPVAEPQVFERPPVEWVAADRPAPQPAAEMEVREPEAAEVPLEAAEPDGDELTLTDLIQEAPETDEAPVAEPEAAPAEKGSARTRLKLTPTATDEEFREVFETAGGRASTATAPAKPPADWTWKDVLSGLHGEDAAADESLAERMSGEIANMGIDPHALLPKARIDEIAAAVQTRDEAGAREVVRKLAPAATRRLVRRLFSDAVLRGSAERFLKRYAGALDEAAESDKEGFLVATLLATDAGRAYLLLDAAAGDLA